MRDVSTHHVLVTGPAWPGRAWDDDDQSARRRFPASWRGAESAYRDTRGVARVDRIDRTSRTAVLRAHFACGRNCDLRSRNGRAQSANVGLRDTLLRANREENKRSGFTEYYECRLSLIFPVN